MDFLADEHDPSPSLDLHISNSNAAEYQAAAIASPSDFRAATPFSLRNVQDETPEAMMFEDQSAFRGDTTQQTVGSARSSTHTAEQFKTPGGGEGKSEFGGFGTSFKQSVAKKVPAFEGARPETCEQRLERILNPEGSEKSRRLIQM